MRRGPLVLLHGFTGGRDSFARVASHVVSQTGSPCIAPSLCGHGRAWSGPAFESVEAALTTWSADGSFESELATLATELANAGVSPRTPALLVGYSLGARMALGLLLTRPTWFRACALIGVNPGLQDPAERTLRKAEDHARARQLLTDGLEPFLNTWEQLPLFASQRLLAPSLLDEQAAQRREHQAAGLAYSLLRTGLGQMPDYWPELAQIQLPVRLVVGALDAKFTAIAEQMRATLASSELTVVPNVGHNVVLEAPSELAAVCNQL